jgi:hypothetical protein
MAYNNNVDHKKQLVFDIETIPQQPGDFPSELEEVITRKLDRAIKQNPAIDVDAERRKIMATDPFLGRIICIGMYIPGSDTKISLTDDSEKKILERFWKGIADFNGLFVSFNGVRFDCPFIVRRSIINRVIPTNSSFLQFNRYDPFPPHFDVMLQLSGRDGFISLKHTCAILGVPSPKDGEIKADGVERAWKEGRIKEIAEYCLRDVVATHKVFEIIYNYVGKN